MKQFAFRSITQSRMAVLGFTILAVCSACGESGESTSKSAGPVYISGGITGIDGSVTGAELTATDAKGEVVATEKVENSSYHLKLPADAVYPVIISAVYPRSTKIVESGQGEVKAAIIEASSSMVEISLKSTKIVERAIAMGGLTRENFEQAAETTITMGGGGGDSGGHGGH